MQQYTITKNTSMIVKGIAILMMLAHHILTFPRYIVNEGYYVNLTIASFLNSPTKLCVGMFAFISGWAYCLSANKTIKYSCNKIREFLITYWIVAIPIITVAVLFCGFDTNVFIIVAELLGLSHEVMIFCWYVTFYIVSMFMLPCIYKLLDRSLIIATCTGIIMPIVVFSILKLLCPFTIIDGVLNDLRHWFPCICVGYICNRYNLFGYVEKYIKKVSALFFLLLAFAICGIGRYLVSALDFIYCAVLVFAISNFVMSRVESKKAGREILKNVGSVSTNMWFLHCIFFGKTIRETFQPVIAWSTNPLVVYFTAVVILWIVSVGFNLIDKKVLKTLKILK